MDAADETPARNRKERRQQAKHFKLKQPDRSGPTGKTLLEFADERRETLFDQADQRQSELSKTRLGQGAEAADSLSGGNDDELIGPFGEALLYSTSMLMLHFTLDVLVYNQYSREIVWKSIFGRTARAFPVILILVYILHPRANQIWTQRFFFGLSSVSGCYLIHAANMYGYLAVMKQAPPLGTLWVWSVIEMRLPFALASLTIVGGYLWWGDYSIL